MFHSEFYPTPLEVRTKIIELITKNNKKIHSYHNILDPSAGKGDLLKIFEDYTSEKYAIEINPELCSLLRGKGYTVLSYDFLEYKPELKHDLIIMNPPFSHCVQHLDRAFTCFPDSDLIAVLPTTFFSKDTKNARLLHRQIEELDGKIENIGAMFSDAERKTKVEVSLLYIQREKQASMFEEFSFDKEHRSYSDKKVIENGLVKRDGLELLITQYHQATKHYEAMLDSRRELTASLSLHGVSTLIEETITKPSAEAYNKFRRGLKRLLWNDLFDQSRFSELMTTTVRKDFNSLIESSQDLAFTKENIESVFSSIIESKDLILKENIDRIFDFLTEYYEENRTHIEGWKTNDRWKVKRKFIIPYIVEHHFGFMSSCYGHHYQQLRDIDIALCSLTGKSMSDSDFINTQTAITDACHKKITTCESTFFKIKLYKRGTAHFEFKELDLWNKFNRLACLHKKWLPK